MSNPLKKVQSGQRLHIPAAAYNAFVDAAIDHRQRLSNIGKESQPSHRSADIVLVRNDSGIARARYTAMGIETVVIDPAENPNDMLLSVVGLDGELHAGRWVVLQEPLANGKIGRAVISGVTYLASLSATMAEHQYVDVNASGSIGSAYTGPAQLLWYEKADNYPSTGWAIIKMGTPAGEPPLNTSALEDRMVYQLRDYGGVLVPAWDWVTVHE